LAQAQPFGNLLALALPRPSAGPSPAMQRQTSAPNRPTGLANVARQGSKSGLLSVNRLLEPKGAQPSGSQLHRAPLGPGNGTMARPAPGGLGTQMRRRHTTDAPAEDGGGSAFRNATGMGGGGRLGSKQLQEAMEADKELDVANAEARKKEKEQQQKDDTDAISCQMALRYRLMLSEVRIIIKQFLKAKRNEAGGISFDDFCVVMAAIFDVAAINKKVARNAYESAGVEKEINIEKFLGWYVQNMFTSVNALTADCEMAAQNKKAYDIADKYKVSNITIDKIKSKFDQYDSDKSGEIDYAEFEAMFCSILKIKDPMELNPDRIKRFWGQVDVNNDGGVDFEEFVDWYLRYFNEDDNDGDDMAGPLQKFYEGFNPTVQRAALVNAHKIKSIESNTFH